MSITKKEVKKVANLSKLTFSDAELEFFSKQMKQILEHVKKVNELKPDDISPTFYMSENKNPLREDSNKPWLSQEDALKNAPDEYEGFFCVPKVIKRKKK